MTSQMLSKLSQLITSSKETTKENRAILPTHLWLQTFCDKCIEDVYYFTEDNTTIKTWCIGNDVWIMETI